MTYSLVFRYDSDNNRADGLDGSEGTFSICSFWYVEALTRVGRLAEARLTRAPGTAIDPVTPTARWIDSNRDPGAPYKSIWDPMVTVRSTGRPK